MVTINIVAFIVSIALIYLAGMVTGIVLNAFLRGMSEDDKHWMMWEDDEK